MIVKNNYNECLTNLACSIRKYFELDYKHNSLDYIDKILEDKKPDNVVVILFDGMGSRIIDRSLDKDDFFIRNRIKEITTVFPATTTAATNSMLTGLNPCEHGWLGWDTYIEPLDKIITLFRDWEKGTEIVCQDFVEAKDRLLVTDTIISEINKIGKYKALELYPFGENKYNDLDDMLDIIYKETKKEGKKYIYVYDDEPDHTMHDLGPDSNEVRELIKIRNKKVEELCKRLDDNTLVIVVADHGHIKAEPIFIKNYPDICEMLEREISIEFRAVSFKIKDGYKEKFENKFREYFGDYFSLYSKEKVIENKLFGDGELNKMFESAIGDYIAIGESCKYISDVDDGFCSVHAGYTEDEVYVPIIVGSK